jgi:hypothetical protein
LHSKEPSYYSNKQRRPQNLEARQSTKHFVSVRTVPWPSLLREKRSAWVGGGRVGVAGGCETGGLALGLEGLGTATVAAPGFMSQAAHTWSRARGWSVAMVAAAVVIAARVGVGGNGGHWSLGNPTPTEIFPLFTSGSWPVGGAHAEPSARVVGRHGSRGGGHRCSRRRQR